VAPEPDAFTGDGDVSQLDLLAASLRAETADLSTFVAVLAEKLHTLLPDHADVQTKRSRLRHGAVTQVAITVSGAGRRLELHYAPGGGEALATTVARVSGGIVLKTEQLDLDTWLRSLAEVIADEARSSEHARLALSQLLLDADADADADADPGPEAEADPGPHAAADPNADPNPKTDG
jgi:hypothetical protein